MNLDANVETRFILGDTETTGPTPADKVCELAWFELDANLNILDRVHSLIDPQIPISHGASGVHGLTDVDVQDAPTIEEFFQIVKPNALCGSVVLIAHNVIFDERYYGPWIPNLVGRLCTLRLARRIFPEVENHKLSTLMYALGLTRGTSHRADGDVETTYDLLCKIVQASGMTLVDLAAESMQPVEVKVMPFGKHKGKLVKQLDKGYMRWLLALDNLDRDMRWTLEQIQAGAL